MNDLISWLRQQTDLDEQALLRRREGHLHCLNFEGQSPEDYTPYDSCYLHIEEAEATPYSDVEFGLRQVAAQRSTLNLCAAAMDAGQIKPGTTWNDDAAGAEVAEATVRLLGEVYQDRPGYREEWRP